VEAQFAVTFNRKDFERYRADWPSIDIFFWIHWEETRRTIGPHLYSVDEMAGVWRASFPAIRHAIEQRAVREHEYLNRLFDQAGNAKASYIVDLRRSEFLGGSTVARDEIAWSGLNRTAPTSGGDGS
jgi:hypothetical protein